MEIKSLINNVDIDVSVIVPVYNTSLYLAQCLGSVLRQSLTNFEIIVVNDCSTDHSAEIVNHYLSQDPRIKLINHTQNLGLPSARNTGVAAARGKYIVHLDSDDFWGSEKVLETLYQVSESDGCEILRFNGQVLEKGKLVRRITSKANFINCNLRNTAHLTHFRSVYLFCFRKSFLEQHDLQFDPKISLGEDGIFLTKALTKAERVSSISDDFYRYRISNNSLMRKKWQLKDFLEELAAFQIMYKTLASHRRIRQQVVAQRISRYVPFQLAQRARTDLNPGNRVKYYKALQKQLSQYNADDPNLQSSVQFTGKTFQRLANRHWWGLLATYVQFAARALPLLLWLKKKAQGLANLYGRYQLRKEIILGTIKAFLRRHISPPKDRHFNNREKHEDFNFKLSLQDKKPGSSAMLRVKNEARNILECLTSIADCFDEIVVVDNASDDTTVEKIQHFQATHPQGQKVTLHHYPFQIARCGEEHQQTAANSVHSLGYFYNWCLSHCHHKTVIKWDGDMQFVANKNAKGSFRNFLKRIEDGPTPSFSSFLVQTVYRDAQQHYWLSTYERASEIRVISNHPNVFFQKGLHFETLIIHPFNKVHRLTQVIAYEIKDITTDEFTHWTSLSFDAPRKVKEYRNYRHLQLGFIKPGHYNFEMAVKLNREKV